MSLVTTPVRLLTIAGSDSAGCAGIGADLRTFGVLEAHGCCAITAVTAQDTAAVLAVEAVPPEIVTAQIGAVATDIGVDAVKIGVLPDSGVLRAVVRALREYDLGPVVVDPVLLSSGGDPFGSPRSPTLLLRELAPCATVLTPNLLELERLTGIEPANREATDRAANIVLKTGAAVIVTGGHRPGDDSVADIVYEGDARIVIEGERIAVEHSRGTGCVYSAALAVGLARGLGLQDSARLAQNTVRAGLRKGYPLGRAARPVTTP